MTTDLTYSERFNTALAEAAATLERPEYGDRLEKAMGLVLAGTVTRNTDGTATVVSGRHTYHLDPEEGCTCADSQYRSGQCKHAIAVALLTQAELHLDTPINTSTNGAVVQAPAMPLAPSSESVSRSAAWQVHESPTSCCLKFTLSGMEILYTMRDVNDEFLFARIRRILPKIQEKIQGQAKEQAKEQTQARAQEQTGGHAAQTHPQGNGQPDLERCTRHNVSMKRYTKGTQSWYSHQAPDGSWCRGR